MVHIFLIGLAAGAASAVLFASVASGSLISILLFYLAPLPILIAAVGWSQVAGLVAALIAASALAVVFGALFFIAFLIGVGLPAWWLGYLALLARPGSAPGAEGLEWYPVGGLVVWAAILGAFLVTIVILTFGFDAETFRTGEGTLRVVDCSVAHTVVSVDLPAARFGRRATITSSTTGTSSRWPTWTSCRDELGDRFVGGR